MGAKQLGWATTAGMTVTVGGTTTATAGIGTWTTITVGQPIALRSATTTTWVSASPSIAIGHATLHLLDAHGSSTTIAGGIGITPSI